jgi:A/G-specific adenine glycosylase
LSAFARKLIVWQRRHGRHGLPWQGTRDPYRVWVAEVMLQQTQVAAVIPYYRRFLARFPDVAALARAPLGEVLRLWSGLGYYARARNLHAAARIVARRRAGRFPDTAQGLARLPGVGRSTAAAIAVFAFGRRAAILDGNVRRVLARHFGVERAREQWRLAESLLPAGGIETYTQALMDLGATVCTRANPACSACPVARSCVARREGRAAELPAPRSRRQRRTRRARWLVLLDRGRVLLERRPANGLWGGLWAFPELRGRDPQRFCREALGCAVSGIRRAPAIEHAFTHFRLLAQPLVARARPHGARRAAAAHIWLDLDEAAHAAVPAPVRKFLLGLRFKQPGERRKPRRPVRELQ